jgi:hypothetical protein
MILELTIYTDLQDRSRFTCRHLSHQFIHNIVRRNAGWPVTSTILASIAELWKFVNQSLTQELGFYSIILTLSYLNYSIMLFKYISQLRALNQIYCKKKTKSFLAPSRFISMLQKWPPNSIWGFSSV